MTKPDKLMKPMTLPPEIGKPTVEFVMRELRNVEFAKQIGSVLRWATVVTGFIFLAKFITDTIVKLSEKPWWEVLLATIVVMATAPGSVFWVVRRRHRTYTSETQHRLAELEKKLDPARTSSELAQDGTNRKGDLT